MIRDVNYSKITLLFRPPTPGIPNYITITIHMALHIYIQYIIYGIVYIYIYIYYKLIRIRLLQGITNYLIFLGTEENIFSSTETILCYINNMIYIYICTIIYIQNAVSLSK